MEKKWLLCLLLTMIMGSVSATNRLDSLLFLLDKTIAESHIHTLKRQAHIRQLKSKENATTLSSLAQYDLNMMLYQEYKAFVCDSAIHYLSRNIEIATRMHDPDRINESKLLLSYLLASCGMYKEAVDMVQSVDRKSLNNRFLKQYYSCYDHAYGELGYYTQDKMNAGHYWQISSAYKDSLYAILDPMSDEYLTMQETSFRDNDKYAEALRINDQRLTVTQFGTPRYANVAFYRSLIFKRNGDKEQEKYYLALSAISDIQSAITDHASLWTLAEILYEEGDVERAYRYIRFSWNETKFYNARLRSWQSSGILSLIDKTYQAMMERKNDQLEQYLLLITVLMLLLLGALTYIYRQMKKLSVARNRLEEANGQLKSLNGELKEMNLCLQSTNVELSESNQIKEEYIARFIKLCSTYIDKLDAYRRMVNKKASANQVAELLKMTRSQEALDKELEELYANFDSAFLHLFPDFVRKFNTLLQEDEQIILKKGELLNTELRIFALIRLGIEDSSQIAEFLRYSVNTIYNYRAKVKNKACVSRDDFENRVLNIR
ncbi:MAG: DUF6377 domain-containing protein [Bacteroides sp.]